MKVKYIALRPLDSETPALTHELLAASAARTSRNKEGIEEIMLLIDPANPEASTKRIFELADYGHTSIKGLTGGIPIFIENISLWQIYDLFRVCTTGDGQETSTRYVNFGTAGHLKASCADIPEFLSLAYEDMHRQAQALYDRLTAFWNDVATTDPWAMGISADLVAEAKDGSKKAQQKLERLQRNFVFDRARVVIPMSCLNNMVLVQTARQWVELCAYLNSSIRYEAQQLGALLCKTLLSCIPNLLKHAYGSTEQTQRITQDLIHQARMTDRAQPLTLQLADNDTEVRLDLPAQERDFQRWGTTTMLRRAFIGHVKRYVPVGDEIGRCGIRFRIKNLGIAELRDLNRHRPGHKFTWASPVGVYDARDQVPGDWFLHDDVNRLFDDVRNFLVNWAGLCRVMLSEARDGFPYLYTLGTQLDFEHLTTLDKFIYTAEIRTGPGAHYRYAAQVRSCLHQVYEQLPGLRGLVLEGSAEPE